ncbi:patatin-like phospholipase-like protein [Trichoderma ceciliae]
MTCNHTIWSRLVDRDYTVQLQVTDRPTRLLDLIRDPDVEAPSLVFLVGNRRKDIGLQQLGIKTTNERGQRDHGDIHMFLASTAELATPQPVFVAESDISIDMNSQSYPTPSQCHEVTEQILPSNFSSRSGSSAVDYMYHRLIFPFADVICLFVDDLGGAADVAQRIAYWLTQGEPSQSQFMPHLVLVAEDEMEASILEEIKGHLRSKTNVDLYSRFEKISLVYLTTWRRLRHGRNYCLRQWDSFKKVLAASIGSRRRTRAHDQTLYSAIHFVQFLNYASTKFNQQSEPFDFVKASRSLIPVATDIHSHFANFLHKVRSMEALKRFAIPTIASSLILDQYPPNMHSFSPTAVFNTLYRQTCLSVSREAVLSENGSSHFVLPSGFAALIETNLTKQFENYQLSGMPSREFHKKQLAYGRDHWVSMKSDITCFSCLMRRPMYSLPCGHSICHICVKIFGQQNSDSFQLETCLLCHQDTIGFQIRVKPDTASVRVLSVDGGGTRARMPLAFLQEIQDYVGLPYPVQHNFDVIFGTSSGAISVCGLCINGWPLEDCIASSEALAKIVFKPRDVSQLPLSWLRPVNNFWQLVLSLALDSRYSSKRLENTLQKLFGSKRSIMDHSAASKRGQFVGMPITTGDGRTYIVTNYNGVGQRTDGLDYDILEPKEGISRIPLWQFYFKPQYIHNIGYIQDGGLTHNNPAAIAIQEAATLFPLTPKTSLVVSLSTGSSKKRKLQPTVASNLLKYFFVARLLQLLLTQNESEQEWKKVLKHQKIGDDGQFFRFNAEFDGKEPSLDNVIDLASMDRIARESIHKSPEVIRLAHCIRAELFCFELDQGPRLVNGVYECIGYLICRLPQGSPGFKALMDRLDDESATFRIGSRCLSSDIESQSIITDSVYWRKMIKFEVSGRRTSFSITLREGPLGDIHISGSPFTIDWLINAQRLDAVFGSSDHRVTNISVPNITSKQHKRKTSCDERTKFKKRRLQ